MPRGGKRKGTGRPTMPPGQKKLKKTITIRPDQLAWLKEQSKQVSNIIEKAIDCYIETNSK